MNPKIMKSFVLGAITAYGFAALVLVSFAKLGILPVQADVAPSRLEASLLGSALRASVARHAPSGGNPIDSEMFWIVKHGIRNTAMPAWGNLLSDEEIWRIVTLVRKFDSVPDSVTLELLGHHR